MKLTGFRLLLGLLASGLFVGCGGGSNPPSNPLSVTTTSLPQGLTAVSYNASLSATGGTPPYSWSIKSGALPSGLSLSSSGTISGGPIGSGASSFVVTVTDTKSVSADSGSLSIAVSGGPLQITTTTEAPGTVGTPYSSTIEATGGVPPYTWAVAAGSSLPDGLSLSAAGVFSGTPTKAGTFSPSIAVTDETGSNTISAPVNFTINPTNPLPDGNYAFEFNGSTSVSDGGNPVVINGAFEVANGTIGIGFYNENVLNQPTQGSQIFAQNSSVAIGPNGLGQIVFQLQGGGSITFALAAPASALKPGNDTEIRIIEFDDTTGTGMRGSGFLKSASFNAAPTFKGGYAFGFRGYDTHSQPVGIVGSFQADGNGNITSGSVDVNDNSTATNSTPVTGSYSTNPGNISGTIKLKIGSDTLSYAYYQVSPTELLVISADTTSATIPMVSGMVLQQQTGPFTNASFTGANVLEMTGNGLSNPATYVPDVTLGLLTSDGKGNVSTSYDEFFNGSFTAQKTYTGTYTVDATTGRAPIASNSVTTAFLYLVSNGKAFVLGNDASSSSGLVEAQTGSPFTKASLKGSYLGGTIPWPDLHVVSFAAADGLGNVPFTSDGSSSQGLESNVFTIATYSVDSTGRAPITVSGDSTPRIFYVVSPTKVMMLSGDSGGYLANFEQ